MLRGHVQYTITNTGDRPLVLTEVEPDCACSVAQWTKTPIAPGAKGTVNVTFDAKALGHFQKSVAIYSNAQPNLVYLKFNGEVVQEIKDFTKTHPYLIGQIRIDKNSLDFPDIQHGEQPVIHIGVVNLSDRPYEPVLMHLPPYLQTKVEPNVLQKGEKGVITLTLNSERLTDLGLTQASVYLSRMHLPPYLQTKVEPNVLQKGEKGVITLTLNSERLTDLGLTQASVYLSRFSGDKVGDENEIPVSAILLPDFSGMTEVEKANAPAINLSTKEVDMSAILAKKSKARQDITITNTGRSPLQINKLQV